jgi:predicted ArsR family transcriptional regulator
MTDFERTHAHRDDPSTSFEAAASARSLARAQRGAIFNLLSGAPKPFSSEELGRFLRLTTLPVRKRIADLKNDGKIEVADKDYTNTSGRPACRYRVARKGQGELFNG